MECQWHGKVAWKQNEEKIKNKEQQQSEGTTNNIKTSEVLPSIGPSLGVFNFLILKNDYRINYNKNYYKIN